MKPALTYEEVKERQQQQGTVKFRIALAEERERLHTMGWRTTYGGRRSWYVYRGDLGDERTEVTSVNAEQLAAAAGLKPDQIAAYLRDVRGRQLEVFNHDETGEGPDTMKQTTKTSTNSNGKAQTQQPQAEKKEKERGSGGAGAGAMLQRINSSTAEQPVIHSALESSTAKKTARQLFRAGKVQRVEREDGQLLYLPLAASGAPAKTKGKGTKGTKQPAAPKEPEARVAQAAAVAPKRARAKRK